MPRTVPILRLAPSLLIAACAFSGPLDTKPPTDGTTSTDPGSGRGDQDQDPAATPGLCSNGILDIGEDCDDGANSDDCDGCLDDCTEHVPFCGDGILCESEFCDDGYLNGEPGQCNLSCGAETSATCGDGYEDPGEECDDGANGDPCDDCLHDCTVPIGGCGDGFACGNEACDDGTGLNGTPGSCNADCSGIVPVPMCGDNVKQGDEECDDGANGNDCDGCLDNCTQYAAYCGDGIQCAGEACDDGSDNGKTGMCKQDCSGLVPQGPPSACEVSAGTIVSLTNRQVVENTGAEDFIEAPAGHVITGLGYRVTGGDLSTLRVRTKKVLSDGSLGTALEHAAGFEPAGATELSLDLPDCYVAVGIGGTVDSSNLVALYLWGAKLQPDGTLGPSERFKIGPATNLPIDRQYQLGPSKAMTGIGMDVATRTINGYKVMGDKWNVTYP